MGAAHNDAALFGSVAAARLAWAADAAAAGVTGA
jgi:hypothetical protein